MVTKVAQGRLAVVAVVKAPLQLQKMVLTVASIPSLAHRLITPEAVALGRTLTLAVTRLSQELVG